jgi:uncharacterized membrane protein YvbJ
VHCSKCGYQLKEEDNFCLKCGTKKSKNKLINNKKNSTIASNTTSKEINTKNPKNGSFILIGVVILLIATGFASYYISFSKFSTTNTKNSDKPSTKNKITPNNDIADKKTDTKSDITTSTDDTDKNKIDSPEYYIFPKSGSEKLLDSDVSILTKDNLTLAKNEIYARHGFAFKTEPFKSYFNSKSWYKINTSFKGINEELNAAELYNIQLILKYEKK